MKGTLNNEIVVIHMVQINKNYNNLAQKKLFAIKSDKNHKNINSQIKGEE